MDEFKLRLERYQPNSLIYIEGNKNNNYFYLLRSGKILTSRIHEVSDDTNNFLKPGDPFGVISCLANKPRIETIRTLTPVEVIAVHRDQTTSLFSKYNSVALKILRWFSNKLREYDSALTRLALKKPVVENTELIKSIGDYYFKHGKIACAKYCYQKFLEIYPDHPSSYEIKQRLNQENFSSIKFFEKKDAFTRIYPDKSMLFCEHEKGDEVFIIQKGRVQITKIIGDEELLLAVLGTGDIVGEMAILDNKPRNASAVTFGETVTLTVNRENFYSMVSKNPNIVLKILILLSERIWLIYRQFENLSIKDEYNRILDGAMIQLERMKVDLLNNTEYNLGLGPVDLFRSVGIKEDRFDELTNRILEDPNFILIGHSLVIKDLKEFLKRIDSIRKLQLKNMFQNKT